MIKILPPKGENLLVIGKSSRSVVNGYLGFYERGCWLQFLNNLVSNGISKIMACIQKGTLSGKMSHGKIKKSDISWTYC